MRLIPAPLTSMTLINRPLYLFWIVLLSSLLLLSILKQLPVYTAATLTNDLNNDDANEQRLIRLSVKVPGIRRKQIRLSLCDKQYNVMDKAEAIDKLGKTSTFEVRHHHKLQPTTMQPGTSSTRTRRSQLLDKRLECEQNSGELITILSLRDLTISESNLITEGGGLNLTLNSTMGPHIWFGTFNSELCQLRARLIKNSTIYNSWERASSQLKGSSSNSRTEWHELRQENLDKFQMSCNNLLQVQLTLMRNLATQCEAHEHCVLPMLESLGRQEDCEALSQWDLSQLLEIEYQCLPNRVKSLRTSSTRTIAYQDLSNRVTCPAGYLLYLTNATLALQEPSDIAGLAGIRCNKSSSEECIMKHSPSLTSDSSWLDVFLGGESDLLKSSAYRIDDGDLDYDRDAPGDNQQEGQGINSIGWRRRRRKRAMAREDDDTNAYKGGNDSPLGRCSLLRCAIEKCHGRPSCSLSFAWLMDHLAKTHYCDLRAASESLLDLSKFKISFSYLCLRSSKWALGTGDRDEAVEFGGMLSLGQQQAKVGEKGGVQYLLSMTTSGQILREESISKERDRDQDNKDNNNEDLMLYETELVNISLSKWMRLMRSGAGKAATAAPSGLASSASAGGSLLIIPRDKSYHQFAIISTLTSTSSLAYSLLLHSQNYHHHHLY